MTNRVPQSFVWTSMWIICAWALLATDLVVPQVNISSAYVVALVIFMLVSGRSSIWRPALVMSACVLVGYLFKRFVDLGSFAERLESVRLLNRLFVISVLLTTASLAPRLQPALEPDAWRRGPEGDESFGDEAFFRDLGRSSTGAFALALLAAIVLFEILSPVTINLTLLAPIPLLLALRSTQRKFVIGLTVCTALLPLAGYGLASLVDEDGISLYVMANRILASLAWTGLAVALYLLVIRRRDGIWAEEAGPVDLGAPPPGDRTSVHIR